MYFSKSKKSLKAGIYYGDSQPIHKKNLTNSEQLPDISIKNPAKKQSLKTKESETEGSTSEHSDYGPIMPLEHRRAELEDEYKYFWSTQQNKSEEKGLRKESKHYQSEHNLINIKNPVLSQNKWAISRFHLLKDLGRGSYGRVILAEEKQTNILVAIKVISKDKIKTNQANKQLAFRELKIHFHLQHSHIIQLYGVFDDAKNIYLVMQYMGQGNLFDFSKNKNGHRLSERKISKYMRQLIDAVDYLHRKNIIHRDLKLENILISDNTVKICDFGCAIHSLGLRKTHVGSLAYFSPEQLKSELYGNKTDVWSLGIIAYELLFGKTPFDEDIVSIVHKGQKNKQLSDLSFPKHITPQAQDFLKRLLEKKPDKRINLKDALAHPFILRENQNERKVSQTQDF